MSTKSIYVMDRRGHGTVAEWAPNDAEAVVKGAGAFAELQRTGHLLYTMPEDGGDGSVVKAFDPGISVLAVPRLVGG
jgi:hypothetical protein